MLPSWFVDLWMYGQRAQLVSQNVMNQPCGLLAITKVRRPVQSYDARNAENVHVMLDVATGIQEILAG